MCQEWVSEASFLRVKTKIVPLPFLRTSARSVSLWRAEERRSKAAEEGQASDCGVNLRGVGGEG